MRAGNGCAKQYQYERTNNVQTKGSKHMGKNLLDKLREERLQQAKEQVKSVNSIKKDVGTPSKEEKENVKTRNLSDLFR